MGIKVPVTVRDRIKITDRIRLRDRVRNMVKR